MRCIILLGVLLLSSLGLHSCKKNKGANAATPVVPDTPMSYVQNMAGSHIWHGADTNITYNNNPPSPPHVDTLITNISETFAIINISDSLLVCPDYLFSTVGNITNDTLKYTSWDDFAKTMTFYGYNPFALTSYGYSVIIIYNYSTNSIIYQEFFGGQLGTENITLYTP